MTSPVMLPEQEDERTGPPADAPSDREARRAAVEAVVAAVRQRLAEESLPGSTYRVQFNAGFTFADAAAIVPYLAALGVTHLYASPYMQATPGSQHGYDLVDPNALSRELGGDAGFDSLVERLRAGGMGHILDWVPNHMGVGTDQNPWWQDVLENGPSSPYAAFFDIDWRPLKTDLMNKVLLPVLGDPFGQVLESGQLTLHVVDGGAHLAYYERRFPIAMRTLAKVLRLREDELQSRVEPPAWDEYQSILTAIGHLPPCDETDPELIAVGRREQEVVKRRLAQLAEQEPAVRAFVAENVAIFNGRPGEPQSFDLLDELLLEQSYRLCDWSVAADEINYRRFFYVNELAALCMEEPAVFDATHARVLQLLDEGRVDGLRIDHADGLYDPTGYLWKLQERRFLQRCRRVLDEGGKADRTIEWETLEPELRRWFAETQAAGPADPLTRSLYLVVEKILEGDERLHDEWPIHGTTGYEFLNALNALFVERDHAKAFDLAYSRFTGHRPNFSELVRASKRLIMRASMSSELSALGYQLDRLSEKGRSSRDFTQNSLTYALREIVACFPVYRTYISSFAQDDDRKHVELAVTRAIRANPAMSRAVFEFAQEMLLPLPEESDAAPDRAERLRFVGRFQQYTGPMMAKAVEDTAFYRYHRLVSLNEVGGNPERFGTTVAAFHRQNQERRELRPFALLATSTHDTKRSEDVRARINVLSELPREWGKRTARWSALNRKKRTQVDGEWAPSRNDEYLLYQTLIGTWPWGQPRGAALAEFRDRILQYMQKALREAKVHTSWIAPNEKYEAAVAEFVTALLDERRSRSFLQDFETLAGEIAACGIWNSLSQTLLKLTSPGVPDTYQGTELWDFSLVDPDNRRPVDYARRAEMLRELDERERDPLRSRDLPEHLLATATDGAIKLFVTSRVLRWRRAAPGLFTGGEYLPLTVQGERADHVCAFARRVDDELAIVVAPRLTARGTIPRGAAPLGTAEWGDTCCLLPEDFPWSWRSVLTPERWQTNARHELRIADLLGRFPVGLLASDPVHPATD